MKTIKINENIARLRKKAGISQEELAKNLKVSNQAVSKWESAKCCPDIELLPELSRFFGISIDELLIGEASIEANSANEENLDLMLQAIKIAQENQKVYTAILQQRLKIGYGTAKNIIDDMYKAGYIVKDTAKSANIYLYNGDHSACQEK